MNLCPHVSWLFLGNIYIYTQHNVYIYNVYIYIYKYNVYIYI